MLSLSAKWKLSISFILLVTALLSLFVYLTAQTFKAGKIASVLEFQQGLVDARAQLLSEQLSQLISCAHNLRVNPSVQSIFWEHPRLLAIEVRHKGSSLTILEKSEGLLASVADLESPGIKALPDGRYAALVEDHDAKQGEYSLRLVFELSHVFDVSGRPQSMALTRNGSTLRKEGIHVDPEFAVSSSASLGFDDLQVELVSDRRQALSALNALYQRSIVFLLFAFFATVVVSLLVSNRMNQKIQSTIQESAQLTNQNYTAALDAAAVKARHELEAQNASLVRRELLPAQSFYRNGQVRLHGQSHPTKASNWWFYFQSGHELYAVVADVRSESEISTALILAASRAIFSFIKDAPSDLKHIAKSWDRAVHQCSGGKARMTAVLMQLNVELGECRIINAGHPAPMLLRKKDGKFQAKYVESHRNQPLGELKDLWQENLLVLEPQDRLLLLSDHPDSQFLNQAEKALTWDLSPDSFAGRIERDATTLIALDFKAKI